MKVRGIKTNYILNIVRTILTTLIGIFTLPYVNSTLGVESVGKVEYINSIITYFVLISALGIPMYGVREVARVRDNIAERSSVVLELLLILFITTVISYVVVFILTLTVFSEGSYRDLIIVLCPIILLTNIGAEWFFQGIEDQLYITIRFIVVKAITLVLLFTLVKTKDDYIIYAGITVVSGVGGNIFNLYRLRKYVNLTVSSLKCLNIKRHFRGILTVFLATISVSIYLQLDITLLGAIGGDETVGLYATANKLVRFSILFITTLGAVMLPRLSYLYDNGRLIEYETYLAKSLKYILFFSVPISALIFSLSREIILVMAGEQFLGAVGAMRILSFLIIIIGIAYYLAFMILYPQGKESLYTKIVVVSAVVSVVMNILLIPKFLHIATASVSVFVELLGIILMIVVCKKQLNSLGFFSKSNLHYFFAGGFICLLIPFIPVLSNNLLFTIFLKSFIGLITYLLYLLIFKDSLLYELYGKALSYLNKNR
ncbi:flippase [Sphingobacterium sp. UME9]|uniref:flippase n=1 Tax=Sphingobacterium sp. UME9 TaxID=1862316 RepID=UPI001600B353|nr:flippase [Sphingobacterium sp. UME9]MBB1645530.1 hypothetical protein [Sphingobacterium sp. UME9]